MDLVVQAGGIKVTRENGEKDDIRVGLVQTAYANGSSTAYVKDTLVIFQYSYYF